MSAFATVGVFAVLVTVLVVGFVLRRRPRSLAERVAEWRRASHASWVGIDDLDDSELAQVISLRYRGAWDSEAVRDRILRRRELAEQLRRSRLPGHRGAGGRRRRPTSNRGRRS